MLNIVIPVGGLGKRFIETGKYHTIKPLIEVICPTNPNKKQTMISMVLDSLQLKGRYIFIVSESQNEKYGLTDYLKSLRSDCEIILEPEVRELKGAAPACLLAKELINNDDELFITNCDQYIKWNSEDFLNFVHDNGSDCCLVTFNGTGDRWSFCQVNDDGLVTKVVEKQKISDITNTGIYYWAKGKDFVASTELMIKNKEMYNQEYYVAPSYNNLIYSGKKILNYPISNINFLSTGTPLDLESYTKNILNRYK